MSELASELREVAVTFPDGAVRRYPAGVTGAEVAADISKSLEKAALAVTIDGRLDDLSRPIEQDARLAIVTARDDAALELIRHDAAHIMARAVQELWPDTKVTIGPVIENGWYYDFDRRGAVHPRGPRAIEARMRQIIAARDPVTTEVWDRDRAIRHYEATGEPYKVELVEAIPAADPIRMYWHGPWQDLCRGPHLAHTGQVPADAFKLMSIAGAYWRGNSRRPMLQRIYGIAFRTRRARGLPPPARGGGEARPPQARPRDGPLPPAAGGAGLGVLAPERLHALAILEAYIRRQLDADGYVEVKTPQLLDRSSGGSRALGEVPREHVRGARRDPRSRTRRPTRALGRGDLLALKPMNCPGHIQIFKQGTKSYRDLPLRMAEFGCCHRNEAHGALHGLMRVRQMTQDDAHIFCREDQIFEETRRFLDLFARVYGDMGMTDIAYKLATRPDLRAGDDASWAAPRRRWPRRCARTGSSSSSPRARARSTGRSSSST